MNSSPLEVRGVRCLTSRPVASAFRRSRSVIALFGWAIVLLAITALPLLGQPASAGVLYWDPAISGGSALGGPGNWNTSLGYWWSGSADQVWSNANFDTAVFSGTAGMVNVGLAISAGALRFDVGGYTLQGGTLTLGSSSVLPTISLDNAGTTTIESTTTINLGNNLSIAGTGSLSLNATLSGSSSLTNLSSGLLTLGGSNTALTGAVYLRNGITSISAANNLGDGSATNTLTLAGGAVLQTTSSLNLGSTRGTVLGLGDGTINVVGSSNTLTVSGTVTSASGTANLVKIGDGTMVLSGANGGTAFNTFINAGIVSISSVSNLSGGSVGLNGGTLYTSATTTLGAANVVRMLSSGGTLSVAPGAILTLGGAIVGSGTINVGTLGSTGTLALVTATADTADFNVNFGALTGGAFLNKWANFTVASGATMDYGNANAEIGSLTGGGTITDTAATTTRT